MTIQQKLMLTMDLSFTSCSLPPSGKLKPFLFLGGLTIFSSFAGFAYLKTAGFSLVRQHLAACLLSLLLVDELHQHTLVLEHVTLGFHVQVVVQMAIDFLCFTIAFQQSPQHSHASNPHKLLAYEHSQYPFAYQSHCDGPYGELLCFHERAREWTASGFLMIKPSLISFLMFWRELALAISLISLGSSQTFLLPHFITLAESLF